LSTSLALKAVEFAVRPPLASALPLTVFIQLAFALPLLPGSLGTHQAACVLALGAYRIPPSEALAFSILAQAGHVIMVCCLNAIAFIVRRTPRDPVSPLPETEPPFPGPEKPR
ncbi:MAG: flippase-like domain-containing protein, partial [Holophagaceae bacterium]|nr:flippase-like domain-containing protein [Holophagaceae bacterium]